MATLRVGDPLDKSTDIGAIVADVQLDRIRALVEQGRAEGAVCYQPEDALPDEGLFYPPTLVTGVAPASILAQEEIFGPVLVSMTFRTQDEALALANNSRYGLAASVWSESINVTLDAAARVKAGVVWVNSTNLFDAAAGFGGYREIAASAARAAAKGFTNISSRHRRRRTARREGRRAGRLHDLAAKSRRRRPALPRIDRTAKLYIGGKQARPDSGYSYTVRDATGALVGQAGLGNRKDIRNAVEAAHAAGGMERASRAHNRAQVLYYLAENLEARADEFSARLAEHGGRVEEERRRGSRAGDPALLLSTPRRPTNTTARCMRRARAT